MPDRPHRPHRHAAHLGLYPQDHSVRQLAWFVLLEAACWDRRKRSARGARCSGAMQLLTNQ
jgi:hypothetical protein